MANPFWPKTIKNIQMKLVIRLSVCLSCFLFAAMGSLSAQNTITASGTVKSGDGSPLAGASVTQKNGKAATVTNQDGYFSLKVQSGATLIISYIGYDGNEVIAGESLDISRFCQGKRYTESNGV
jgi:hypothetical protein